MLLILQARTSLVQLVTAIAISVLLGACSAPKIIPADAITFQTESGAALSERLRMTLILKPGDTQEVDRALLPMGAEFYRWIQKAVDTQWPLAAKKVFALIAQISEDTTFAPHLIAHVKPDAGFRILDTFYISASVDLYWGTGEFIGTFKEGNAKIYPKNSTDIYNDYVEVFTSIVEQMLADKSLVRHFKHGIDDSLASTTPNIPQQLPYLARKRAEKARVTEKRRIERENRRASEAVLVKARSRGYVLSIEFESILSLGPVPSHLDAIVLESLLPFSREMEQAFEQGNLWRVQSVSRQWRSWLKRIQPYVGQEAEDSVRKQLAQLDKLDLQLSDPVQGKLTIKLAQAIKQERWEDAKNIQELIRAMEPPEPTVVVAPTPVQPSASAGSSQASCRTGARTEYESALAAYNAALGHRDNMQAYKSGMGMAAEYGASQGTVDPRLGILNILISGSAYQRAGSDILIAKERLDRAKARLDSCNWR